MTPDERNLLLLLARMVASLGKFHPEVRELRAAIARIEAAEDRAADEERTHGRG